MTDQNLSTDNIVSAHMIHLIILKHYNIKLTITFQPNLQKVFDDFNKYKDALNN